MSVETAQVVPALASLVIPAAAGLVGVVIGALLSSLRDQSQRRLAFVEQQLQHFYSPMQGLREEIAATSALRLRIQDSADIAWRELCAQVTPSDREELARLSESRHSEFKRTIDYDNNALNEELLPAYRRMTTLFRDYYWLAEKETRTFYPAVLEYAEIWERRTAQALPIEVWRKLNHSEENLTHFYRHIAETHEVLRSKLQDGYA